MDIKIRINSNLLSDIENMRSLKILQYVKTEGEFLQMMDILQTKKHKKNLNLL